MTKLEQNAQPESNLNLNDVVDGKTLSEWVMSDHGLVDYSKLKFGHNVSNTKGRVIFDLGEYEFDPDVRETVYQNGVDLARVAACARYHTEYKGMRFKTAIDGWDHMMSFLHGYRNATISDYVIYFFQILDGDIYISETCHHVFVSGRACTSQEEWAAAVDEMGKKWTGRRRDRE